MKIKPWTWPSQVSIATCVGCIRVYQKTLSPLLGPICRFEPSCSNYMIVSLRKHGLIRGLGKGAWRIVRCNPFHPGGFDPP